MLSVLLAERVFSCSPVQLDCSIDGVVDASGGVFWLILALFLTGESWRLRRRGAGSGWVGFFDGGWHIIWFGRRGRWICVAAMV